MAALAEDKDQLDMLEEKRRLATQKADEKIDVATRTYDLVDSHIRKLDADLKAFEASLRAQGLFEDASLPDSALDEVPEPEMEALTKAQVARKQDKVSRKRDRNARAGGVAAAAGSVPLELLVRALCVLLLACWWFWCRCFFIVGCAPQAGTGSVTEEPIDPNEPLYCLCRRVSFGAMVGCEADDCPIEWFHYGCVGLTEEPKGVWYCPNCRKVHDRKKGRA